MSTTVTSIYSDLCTDNLPRIKDPILTALVLDDGFEHESERLHTIGRQINAMVNAGEIVCVDKDGAPFLLSGLVMAILVSAERVKTMEIEKRLSEMVLARRAAKFAEADGDPFDE